MQKRKAKAYRPRRDSERGKHLAYEQFKSAWRFRHPDATPAEYEQAMQKIAREIGI